MKPPNPEIELGLSLAAVFAAGRRLTHRQIAAWCGCTRQTIYDIEQSALRKLRFRARHLIQQP